MRELFPLWLPGCLLSSAPPKETLPIYPLGGKNGILLGFMRYLLSKLNITALFKSLNQSLKDTKHEVSCHKFAYNVFHQNDFWDENNKRVQYFEVFWEKMSSYISHQKSRPSKNKYRCVNITSWLIKSCFQLYFSITFPTVPRYPAITCFTACKMSNLMINLHKTSIIIYSP